MPILRRAALPDDVRHRLALVRGERVLGHGRLTDGWAVATTRGLVVVPTDGDPRRRDWSEVSGARLDPETETVTVDWVDGSPPAALRLAEPDRQFAGVLRQCVDSSVIHRETVALPGRAVVQVALRRGADGDLFTQVIGPGGVDLSDPATAAAVDAAELRVREAAGLR